MKNFLTAVLVLSFLSFSANASSLDELYRDLIKSDNEGYLPMFVKNRKTPDILIEDNIPNDAVVVPGSIAATEAAELNFINERRQEELAKKQALLKWESTVKSVQAGIVTPVELQEILKNVDAGNPKAVEIYAWMNTKGVGIEQNLIKAFNLYQKAHKLGVKDAERNAALVYQALTPEQRASLSKSNF